MITTRSTSAMRSMVASKVGAGAAALLRQQDTFKSQRSGIDLQGSVGFDSRWIIRRLGGNRTCLELIYLSRQLHAVRCMRAE